MKRIHEVVAIFLLSGAVAAMGQNLLTNPGFESQGAGWTLFFQNGTVAQGTVTYPATGAHGGSRYARIDVTTPAASADENWHIQLQPQAWTATLGATYEFKFWAKSDSASPIHVSVQGSDYTYLTGTSFGLSNEWTEYSLTYVAEASGSGAVRFHVYVAEAADVYSFDDFSVTAIAAGVRPGVGTNGQGFSVRREPGRFVVSPGKGIVGGWKAELVDLRGTTIASARGRDDGSASLANPAKAGAYFIRASTPAHAWVRRVMIP